MDISINIKQIFAFALLYIINAIVVTNPYGVAFVALQFLFVLYYVINSNLQKAVFWHMIFMITSYSPLSFSSTEVDMTYNYFALKLYGPITLSYLFSIIILLISLKKSIIVFDRNNIFLRMRKYFYLLGGGGVLLGVIGLVFQDYFVEKFVDFTVYITILLIHVELLLRNNKGLLLRKCFEACVPLLIASVVGNLFNYFANIQIAYGVEDTYLSSVISQFVLLLVLAVPVVKNKVIVILTIIVSVILTLYIGSSGKFFTNLVLVGLLYFLRLLSSKQIKHRAIYSVFTIIIIAAVSTTQIEFEGLTSGKYHQFKSLENVYRGDISNIDRSPYIRVASIMNIYKENIENPIYFLIGRGYGGYFQDDLNILRMVNLGNGGFKDEYVMRNKFPTAHSTYATVPLLNGFGGFVLIIILIVMYGKRCIKDNYLGGMALLWLLNMFYFNILIGLVGVFFLFSSEYKINYGYIKK